MWRIIKKKYNTFLRKNLPIYLKKFATQQLKQAYFIILSSQKLKMKTSEYTHAFVLFHWKPFGNTHNFEDFFFVFNTVAIC